MVPGEANGKFPNICFKGEGIGRAGQNFHPGQPLLFQMSGQGAVRANLPARQQDGVSFCLGDAYIGACLLIFSAD